MENDNKIKALNILFKCAFISLLVSILLVYILSMTMPGREGVVAIISPTLTYCIGRYLCNKEYQ